MVISSDTISEHIDGVKTVGRLRLKLWKASTEKEKQNHKLRDSTGPLQGALGEVAFTPPVLTNSGNRL